MIGSRPAAFAGRLNSISGNIASSCLIALLIFWSSRNRLDKRIEPAFECWPVPVCISAEVYLGAVAVRLNYRPHSLMREKENTAQRQDQQREPDVYRGTPGIILNGQRVCERDLLKISQDDFVPIDQQRIIAAVFEFVTRLCQVLIGKLWVERECHVPFAVRAGDLELRSRIVVFTRTSYRARRVHLEIRKEPHVSDGADSGNLCRAVSHDGYRLAWRSTSCRRHNAYRDLASVAHGHERVLRGARGSIVA